MIYETTEDEPSVEWEECIECSRRMALSDMYFDSRYRTWLCPECAGDDDEGCSD